MSEETQFWGLAVKSYDQEGRASALLKFPASTPGSERFQPYRVFSSRERADQYVQGHWQKLSQELIEQTVDDIRQIRRDEIPAKDYVSLDESDDHVTWEKLLAGG
jgi:hypothetical protein